MIIAIDGPAASGKGTIGRKLSEHYGYKYLDTGLLYRGVAKELADRQADPRDELAAVQAAKRMQISSLSADGLANYGSLAATVAAFPSVRAVLIETQRAFGRSSVGAVLDGRDIGTVIFPDAEVKIFVTASPEVRARRRFLELRRAGQDVDEAAILADITDRDHRDQVRPVSPLRPAPDAVLLDTTHLDISSAVRAAIDIVEAVRAGRRPA